MMRAINDIVIVIQDQAEIMTKSGILIPENFRQRPNIGTIISVGDKVNDIDPGDRISWNKLNGKGFTYNNCSYVMVHEKDIQFKISNDEIIPIGNNMIVRQDQIETKTEAGIHINIIQSDHLKPNTGVILKIGSKVEEMKVNTRIGFSMYAGKKITFEDQDYILMRENEVLFTYFGDKIKVGETHDIENIIDNVNSIFQK